MAVTVSIVISGMHFGIYFLIMEPRRCNAIIRSNVAGGPEGNRVGGVPESDEPFFFR